MDADGWRKPLTSKVYGDCSIDLRTGLANVTKKMCKEDIKDESLEAFVACRPLDKMPGLRSISVGKVLRKICGKTIKPCLSQNKTSWNRVKRFKCALVKHPVVRQPFMPCVNFLRKRNQKLYC